MGGASLQVDEWGLLYSIDKPTYTQARGGSLQERGNSGGVCGGGGGYFPKVHKRGKQILHGCTPK